MVSDLFVFDLETFAWKKVPPHPEDDVPGARYFHSTDSCEFLAVVRSQSTNMVLCREQPSRGLWWNGSQAGLVCGR